MNEEVMTPIEKIEMHIARISSDVYHTKEMAYDECYMSTYYQLQQIESALEQTLVDLIKWEEENDVDYE